MEAARSQHGTSSQTAAPALWFGLLGAPVVWFGHFLAIWAISEWGCLAGWGGFTILGLDVVTTLVGLGSLLALPIVAAAGVTAWRAWRRAGENERESGQGAYMGFGGVILGILFGTLIVLETIPMFVLGPCG